MWHSYHQIMIKVKVKNTSYPIIDLQGVALRLTWFLILFRKTGKIDESVVFSVLTSRCKWCQTIRNVFHNWYETCHQLSTVKAQKIWQVTSQIWHKYLITKRVERMFQTSKEELNEDKVWPYQLVHVHKKLKMFLRFRIKRKRDAKVFLLVIPKREIF